MQEPGSEIIIRAYQPADLEAMRRLWNEIVAGGDAFPQEQPLSAAEAAEFFAAQSRSAVAELAGEIAGLYILHPNNVGRGGHLATASYAVRAAARGRHIGELLVRDSLHQARLLGFRLLQFNAVVCGNTSAINLYRKLGFTELGTVPGGFRLPDGSYQDILLFYRGLDDC